jgi:hypothetical protein
MLVLQNHHILYGVWCAPSAVRIVGPLFFEEIVNLLCI